MVWWVNYELALTPTRVNVGEQLLGAGNSSGAYNLNPLDWGSRTALTTAAAVSLILALGIGCWFASGGGAAKAMPQATRHMILLLIFGLFEIHLTLFAIVPVSFDLAFDMGGGQVLSGVIISAMSAGALVGTLLAKWLSRDWDQARMYRRSIETVPLLLLGGIGFATAVMCDQLANPVRIVLCVGSRFVMGVAVLLRGQMCALQASHIQSSHTVLPSCHTDALATPSSLLCTNRVLRCVGDRCRFFINKMITGGEQVVIGVAISAAGIYGSGAGPLLSTFAEVLLGGHAQAHSVAAVAQLLVLVPALLWLVLWVACGPRSNAELAKLSMRGEAIDTPSSEDADATSLTSMDADANEDHKTLQESRWYADVEKAEQETVGLLPRRKEQQAAAAPPAADVHAIDGLRASLWIGSVVYSMERIFLVAGLEVVTAVILELEFDLQVASVGMAVACTFLAGIPLMCLDVYGATFLSEQAMLIINSSLVFCLTPLLLEALRTALHLSDVPAMWLLLSADLVIYPVSMASQGSIYGLALAHGNIAGSIFNAENYITLNTVFTQVARLVAPPTARYLFQIGGRNVYAIFQMALALSSVGLCLFLAHVLTKFGVGRRKES